MTSRSAGLTSPAWMETVADRLDRWRATLDDAWFGLPPRVRHLSLAALAVLVTLEVALMLIPDPETVGMLGSAGMTLGSFAAGLLILWQTGSFDGRERIGWRLIAMSLLVVTVGTALLGIEGLVAGMDAIPAFGPVDSLFIVTYLLALAGTLVLPQAAASVTQRLRMLLDGLVGAVSIGVVLWLTVLGDLLGQMSRLSGWSRWAGTAYPLLDLVILVALALMLVRRSTHRFDVRLLGMAAGFVLQVLADLSYLTAGADASFTDAQPRFVLLIGTQIVFLITGMLLRVRPPAREYADRPVPVWAMVVPYGAALAMMGMLVAYMVSSEYDARLLILQVAAITVGVLVIGRQAVAIAENRSRLEEERSALVSSVSHELRTPLSAIVGFVDVLASGQVTDPAEHDELLEIVQSQSKYLVRVVSDLVMLSRDTLAEVPLNLQPSSVSELVAGALEAVPEKRGNVATDLPVSVFVRVDPARMRQMLVNLITNALRYGHGKVLVRAVVEGPAVHFEVHDNGPGVPKRYELSIWNRFERGSHRLDAVNAGSGIGLAVVRELIKAHGGSASYRRSELLDGACFSLTLPAA